MKHRSAVAEERAERRKKKILAFIIIGLMVFSSVAFAINYITGSGSTTVRYNGYKLKGVVNEQGFVQGYTTEVNDKELFFYSAPTDSLVIPLPADMISTLKEADALIFLFDPQDNYTQLYDQLRFDFKETIPQEQYPAVTQSSTTYPFVVASCANSSAQAPFIYFKQGPRAITADNNSCYVVSGEQYDFALLRDRIVYAYYGITQE
jgi:hypothetical protein